MGVLVGPDCMRMEVTRILFGYEGEEGLAEVVV